MNLSQLQEKEESVQAVPSLPISGKRKISTRNVSGANFSVASNQVLNQSLKSASSVEDDTFCVIAAPPASAIDTTEQLSNNPGDPTHIPVVEESTTVSNGSSSSNNIDNTNAKGDDEKGEMEMENNKNNDNNNNKSVHLGEDVMSDESEYEYEDDDDAAFSGFLIANNDYGTTSNNNNNNNNNNYVATSSTAPARIVEEDTGTVAASSRSLATNSKSASSSATSSLVDGGESEGVAASASAVAEPVRRKWREPSRAAVNMSLRAQQETSGSKRRLAQDLYRIMNQDTKEAGFSLAPQTEDSMEKWTIKLFQFDPDSNLAKDMMVLGIDHVELEMRFPEQYPFEPPFVRVVKPRFKRQTGFVMNGALCMELLTKDGWNPINDIESVIVSVRSLLVVGDGRIQAATDMTKAKYETLLSTAQQEKLRATSNATDADSEGGCDEHEPEQKKARTGKDDQQTTVTKSQVGSYSATEAQAAYSHLSDYHKKKGWDTSGWWARKG
jgi:ubiquitin-conjugating enzyme E2 Q